MTSTRFLHWRSVKHFATAILRNAKQFMINSCLDSWSFVWKKSSRSSWYVAKYFIAQRCFSERWHKFRRNEWWAIEWVLRASFHKALRRSAQRTLVHDTVKCFPCFCSNPFMINSCFKFVIICVKKEPSHPRDTCDPWLNFFSPQDVVFLQLMSDVSEYRQRLVDYMEWMWKLAFVQPQRTAHKICCFRQKIQTSTKCFPCFCSNPFMIISCFKFVVIYVKKNPRDPRDTWIKIWVRIYVWFKFLCVKVNPRDSCDSWSLSKINTLHVSRARINSYLCALLRVHYVVNP